MNRYSLDQIEDGDSGHHYEQPQYVDGAKLVTKHKHGYLHTTRTIHVTDETRAYFVQRSQRKQHF
jgi:hypothetical protein